MEVVGKLVRDGVPEIIRNNGDNPITRVLSAEEYEQALSRKLIEEAEDYLSSGSIEELADILQVFLTILDHKRDFSY